MLTRDDFAGMYTLRRTIEDRHLNQIGDFRGSALLKPQGVDGLDYHEFGHMRFGDGPVMRAQRTYRWTVAGDVVDVRFEDGAPFHQFTPDGQAPGTDHPCGADFYTVVYDFTAWPDWQTTWTVTGPRKDYTSVSVYGGRKPFGKGPNVDEMKPLRQFTVTPLSRD